MKITRQASAVWKGSGKEGKGTLTTASKVLDETPYAFNTRFEDGKGTNPEELLGAAHAGCFAMQLSFLLSEKAFVPETLDVKAKVTLEDGGITHILLQLQADVPHIKSHQFEEIAMHAKEICPVSKLFDTTIDLEIHLE
ncbi:OsmC family protein [Formosa sp. A9]|uniref:OsmC family protein n=1 Tax=Formosa sp. A9 TaxID=3442641 RepID=UPI003EBC70FF